MKTSKSSRRYLILIPVGFAAFLGLGAAPVVGVVRSITAGFGLSGGGTGEVTLAVDASVIQSRPPMSAETGHQQCVQRRHLPAASYEYSTVLPVVSSLAAMRRPAWSYW